MSLKWRMCIIMLNGVVSGKIMVLFCDRIHMAIFFCPVVQHRVKKWQVSSWIGLVVLQLLFFWSDINICCVCMRLMFYNKYIFFEIVISDELSAYSFQYQTYLVLDRGFLQGGREVTVHPENTHLRLNISLQCTAQHAVQCKMVGWQQCAR